MNISKERKIEEGLLRLKELEVAFDLCPNIYKYFKEGKLYYSYLVGGLVGCIDTINYDERYAKVVKKFEEYYKKAMKNPFIRKPIAWSLYQTWIWVNENEKERDT